MSILLIAQNTNEAKAFSKLAQQGQLRRLYVGIYTQDLNTPIEQLIQTHWLEIIPHIVPQGIVSFNTALALKPLPLTSHQTIVFMTSTYRKTITLPGLVINIQKGNVQDFTVPLTPRLAKSNEARMLLENLTPVKIPPKTCGPAGVEHYLAKVLHFRGEKVLKELREAAEMVAHTLKLEREYKILSKLIGVLLGTQTEVQSQLSPYAKAVLQKTPYDEHRVALFQKFALYLKTCTFIERPYVYSATRFKTLAFFESYFSNYIEGTQFFIDEAEDIVFAEKIINNRHADSHDVLAHHTLSANFTEVSDTPSTLEDFLHLLQHRHALLLQERPEKAPGTFKTLPNKAGSTFFVAPEEVVGTLGQGFEMYQLLAPGLARALFMGFMVSEIHPFADGNGRIARIMMNAELVAANLFKIIVPTVCRDNYLNGLRLATRQQNFYTYCKVLDQLQAYTSSLPWQDYAEVRAKLEQDHAEQLPDDGLPIFYRALRTLTQSDLPTG